MNTRAGLTSTMFPDDSNDDVDVDVERNPGETHRATSRSPPALRRSRVSS